MGEVQSPPLPTDGGCRALGEMPPWRPRRMFNVKFSLGFSSEVVDTVWWQSNGQSNGSKVAIQWVAIQWSSRVVAIQWEKGARGVAREVAREVFSSTQTESKTSQQLHEQLHEQLHKQRHVKFWQQTSRPTSREVLEANFTTNFT